MRYVPLGIGLSPLHAVRVDFSCVPCLQGICDDLGCVRVRIIPTELYIVINSMYTATQHISIRFAFLAKFISLRNVEIMNNVQISLVVSAGCVTALCNLGM